MAYRVCVVTGTRAEYGLLKWVMKELLEDDSVDLRVIATGMHLSPEFGLTYREIEQDGFTIGARVEMLLSSDSSVGVAKSIGLGAIGFADAFQLLRPELVVVLGDRFETFAAAQVAMVLGIPIAHLGGGDIGAGTYDNIFRPCITLMSSLHFVTHQKASQRVIQLGANPDTVHCFGSTGTDNVVRVKRLSKPDLARELGIKLRERMFLVTFHPLTLDEDGEAQFAKLLGALDDLRKDITFSTIFTRPNADHGGRSLSRMLDAYVERTPDCFTFDSLGQLRYLSAVEAADVVVGNSSSGIYEAPYLSTPTVDIGSRQQGRESPVSVFRCAPERPDIVSAIRKALAFEFKSVQMVYGSGYASGSIAGVIRRFVEKRRL